MANRKRFKQKKNTVTADWKRFPGIDRRREQELPPGAAECVNFRIDGCGALEKRCGYGKIYDLPGKPIAVFSREQFGEEIYYHLVGSSLLKVALQGGGATAETLLTLPTEVRDGGFVYCDGRLILFTDAGIYAENRDGGFSPAAGYIPLYAKDWTPMAYGPIHECENRLRREVRFHFLNQGGGTELDFGRRVEAIVGAKLDGVFYTDLASIELLSDENYGTRCHAEIFHTAHEIELCVRLPDEGATAPMRSCTRAFRIGEADAPSLLAYGGEREELLYRARGVSEEAERESASFFPEEGGHALYFPKEEKVLSVEAPLMAVSPMYDRVFLFTKTSAWVAESEKDGISVVKVNDTYGCDQRDGAVLAGDSPVTVFGGRLYQWKASRTARTECEAVEISTGSREKLLKMGIAHTLSVSLAYYPASDALFVALPEEEAGGILIYGNRLESVYRYKGMAPARLLESRREPTFYQNGAVYRFLEELYTDEGGKEILASYRTPFLEFGDPVSEKKALHLYLEGESGEDGITLTVESDKLLSREAVLFPKSLGSGAVGLPWKGVDRTAERPDSVFTRIPIGRFRSLFWEAVAGGASRERITRVILSVHAVQNR